MSALTDQAANPKGGVRKPALSASTLGFLCLVPVALLLVAQALQLGFFLTVGSSIPASDSNLWASCASAFANGNESYNLAWCLRRPLTILAQAPFFALAPDSMAAVLVLQLLVVSLAFWWFLISITRTLPVGRVGILIVYALGLFPLLWYGSYLGPEALALALSLVSAGAIVRFASTRRAVWGVVAAGTAIVVLQIRPGNFLLTGVLAVGVLVALRMAGRRWVAVFAVAAALLAVWLLPTRVLGVVGWPAAGHASNFWSTAYSAATPEDDTWVVAYDKFAPELGCPVTADWTPDPCLALESEAFGLLLRDSALDLMRQDPAAVPRQMATNVGTLLGDGYLNQMWGHPYSPAWQLWQQEQRDRLTAGWSGVGTAAATALWIASWVLVGLMAVRVVRMGRRGSPFASDGQPSDRAVGASLWIGLVTVAGAAASFALVGHDEPQRHLVQNIPYVLLAVGGLAAAAPRSDQSPSPAIAADGRSRRWPLVLVWVLISMTVLTGIVEGHATGPTIRVARDCSGASEAEAYDVIASAALGTGRPLPGPSDWRRLEGVDTSVAFSDISWIQQMLRQLPPGQILDLRSTSTGEVIPVFLSDDDLIDVGGDWQATAWCTSSPSESGVMIVHDLVPIP